MSTTRNDFFRQVLCELQVALVERQLSSRPDVTRDIMKSEYRGMSSSETYRNLRDWLIFRDYMNGLEYVVQVFEHLRRGLESWGWQGGSRRRATRRRLAHLRKPEQPNLDGQLSWRAAEEVGNRGSAQEACSGKQVRRAPRVLVSARWVSASTTGLSINYGSTLKNTPLRNW